MIAFENNSGLMNELHVLQIVQESHFLTLLFKLFLKIKFSLRCKNHLSISELHLFCSGYHGDNTTRATAIWGKKLYKLTERMQNNTLECNVFMKIHKVKTVFELFFSELW